MTDSSRILEIPESEMTAEQKQVLADLVKGRGKMLSPYKIWFHSPKLAAAMEKIGTFLNKRGSLTTREVELVICLIAHHWKGDYVWASHVNTCLELGYPLQVFEAIKRGEKPAFDSERERTVYELATIAMGPGAGPDEVFLHAEKVLGRNGIAEVLALLGYYSAVTLGMKVHRVPVRAPIPASVR